MDITKEDAIKLDSLLKKTIERGALQTYPSGKDNWSTSDEYFLELLKALRPDIIYHDSGMYLEVTPIGRSFFERGGFTAKLNDLEKRKKVDAINTYSSISKNIISILGGLYIAIDVAFTILNDGIGLAERIILFLRWIF